MANIDINWKSKNATRFFKGIAKNVKGITEQKSKDYMKLLAINATADVLQHFQDERGPSGAWRAIRRQGKILNDSSNLKQHVQPGHIRKIKNGWAIFNNAVADNGFPYAVAHDEGKHGQKQRQFMWLSSRRMKKIEKETVQFMLMK